MHFDRGLAGERRRDALAHFQDVGGFLLERCVEQLAQDRVDDVAQQFRRHGRDRERVPGEALDVEADVTQFRQMRLERRSLGRAGLVEDRREELLRHRLAGFDAFQIPVVEHALVRDVLIDQTETARHVDEDVTHPVLTDDAALEIAEVRLRLVFDVDQRSCNGRALSGERRLHHRALLEERRELGSPTRPRVVSLRCEES